MTVPQFSRIAARAAIATGAALVLCSCGMFDGVGEDETIDWSAQKLYESGHEYLLGEDWSNARMQFGRIESRYPFGRYAQQAMLESAYAYYKENDAVSAIQICDRFLQQYPTHPSVDYALYIKALATLNSSQSFFSRYIEQELADRDPDANRMAFDILRDLVQRFPKSRYAAEARRRMGELVEAQADFGVRTARFYYERFAYAAAINRCKDVLAEFQDQPAALEALHIMADSYAKLGLTDLEADVRRVIARNEESHKR